VQGCGASSSCETPQLKEEAAARKFEQLEFELEARTSQYITWFVKNYMKKVDKEVGFADGVTPEKLIASLRVFADLPQTKPIRLSEHHRALPRIQGSQPSDDLRRIEVDQRKAQKARTALS
jgi:hypothetical protein